jgi:hypothetical protein
MRNRCFADPDHCLGRNCSGVIRAISRLGMCPDDATEGPPISNARRARSASKWMSAMRGSVASRRRFPTRAAFLRGEATREFHSRPFSAPPFRHPSTSATGVFSCSPRERSVASDRKSPITKVCMGYLRLLEPQGHDILPCPKDREKAHKAANGHIFPTFREVPPVSISPTEDQPSSSRAEKKQFKRPRLRLITARK